MNKYVMRLVRCGYSKTKAISLCEEFSRNLPLISLEWFVESVERRLVCG